MGQYWVAVNLDKKETLTAWDLDGGAKIWEQLMNNDTAQAVLYLCTAMPEQRGGGDFAPGPNCGRWAGDRIAWVGDYAEDGDLRAVNPEFREYGGDLPESKIYGSDYYDNITHLILDELKRARE